MAKAFICRVLQVNKVTEVAPFDIMIEVTLLGSVNTAVNLTFSAPWGSDWRMMARQAVMDWAVNNYSESVDGIVFPDLTTA